MPTKNVADVITAINNSMTSLGFEIRRGTSETDAKHFYAMCNTKADAAAQLATHFKPVELRYFRQVVRIHSNTIYLCFAAVTSLI